MGNICDETSTPELVTARMSSSEVLAMFLDCVDSGVACKLLLHENKLIDENPGSEAAPGLQF